MTSAAARHRFHTFWICNGRDTSQQEFGAALEGNCKLFVADCKSAIEKLEGEQARFQRMHFENKS